VCGRREFLGGMFAGALGLPWLGALAASEEESSAAGRPLSYNSVHVDRPLLALTFDDGPHPNLTPRLLDILAEREAKVTFYVIGQNAAAHPDIVRRMVEEGHEIANHTWAHPALSKASADRVRSELRRTHQVVEDLVGVKMQNMRPPYGAVNDRVRKIARDEFDYTTIMWSVDPQDWKIRNATHVRNSLVQGATAGAILLCHDIHASTIEAIPGAVDTLLDKGYEFATVGELLDWESDLVIPPPHGTV